MALVSAPTTPYIVDVYGDPVPFTYKGTYEFQGGDAIYEDINYDGKIDLLDAVYLGDSNPQFTGGFGGSFKWKKLVLSTQFHFRTGYQIVNEVAMNTEGMNDKINLKEKSDEALDEVIDGLCPDSPEAVSKP